MTRLGPAPAHSAAMRVPSLDVTVIIEFRDPSAAAWAKEFAANRRSQKTANKSLYLMISVLSTAKPSTSCWASPPKKENSAEGLPMVMTNTKVFGCRGLCTKSPNPTHGRDSYENRIPNQLKLTMTFYFHSRWRIEIHDLLCQKSGERIPHTVVCGCFRSFLCRNESQVRRAHSSRVSFICVCSLNENNVVWEIPGRHGKGRLVQRDFRLIACAEVARPGFELDCQFFSVP